MTLAARRWGLRVGGLLVSLPVMAGPTLGFFAVEQGPAFAARAAQGTLLSLVALAVFCVAYARLCVRTGWKPALAGAYVAWGIMAFALEQLAPNLLLTLAVVFAAGAIAGRALPPAMELGPAVPAPRWDLPLRMAAAAALVLLLTGLAEELGPQWSGLLAPFPVATAVIAGFTHAQRGPASALAFFHGFVPAMGAFAVFCFVLSLAVVRMPLAAALGAALAAHLVFQGFLLWTASARLSTMRRAPLG